MLVVELTNSTHFTVKCQYHDDYIRRLHQIQTATFNRALKKWMIHRSEFLRFESIFQGEIVYKTPRWVILNEPMPDMSKMYQLSQTYELPASKLQPYDYQRYGIQFMIDKLYERGFVINADGVGLGKTIMSILTIAYMVEHERLDKVLILCKKSIKRQWIKEIQKFSYLDESFEMFSVEGTKKQREKIYQQFKKEPKGILVMNYQLVPFDLESLKDLGFQLVVIDEAHCIKARTGKINGAIKKITQKADYVLFLTGTPIMSRPDDLYGIIQLARSDFFPKWKEFEKHYIFKEFNGSYHRVIGYRHLDELRNLVQSILIQRTEFEVSIDLPETVYHQVDCEWDSVQERLKNALDKRKQQLGAQLQKLSDSNELLPFQEEQKARLEASIKGLISAYQMIANDPRLFHYSRSQAFRNDFGGLVPESYEGSSKTQQTLDVISEIVEAGQKVIIFSQYETCIQFLANEIQEKLKLPVLQYTGQVCDEDRERHVELFMEDDDYPILAGTNAMAEGINLMRANHVLNYEQPDTPAIKIQRGGRARRASSTFKSVFIHDMITEQSKDVEKLENLNKIMGLVDGVVSVDQAQSESLKKIMSQY